MAGASTKIEFKCENGHAEVLTFKGMDREYAVEFARICDGSSEFFIKSPRGDPQSLIGKCGICKGQVTCTVMEEA